LPARRARRGFSRARSGAQRQHNKFAITTEVDQLSFVLDWHIDHAPVPAQVVHPLQARDAVNLLPFRRIELRLEPSAEGEIGKSEGRPGQLGRRAQCFHARPRRPWSLETGGRTIEHAQAADREALQRECRRQSGHSRTDDRDVQHRPVFRVRARLEPVLRGRQGEQFEIARESAPRARQAKQGRDRKLASCGLSAEVSVADARIVQQIARRAG
jgi:hypothetical protein